MSTVIPTLNALLLNVLCLNVTLCMLTCVALQESRSQLQDCCDSAQYEQLFVNLSM